jgi:hypothetical protein
MKTKTVILVEYSQNGGIDQSFEAILENAQQFEKWLKYHNEERIRMGWETEEADEFNLHEVTMFTEF